MDYNLNDSFETQLLTDDIFYDNKYISLDFADKLNKTIVMVSVSDALGGINNYTKPIHIES